MGWISTIINGVKDVAIDKPFQKGFWYDQMEYNSPKNQVKRLEEAGINPALAIGNIQSGQGASIPSTNPNIAAGVSDSILGLINNKRQQDIMESEARQKNSNALLQEIDAFTRFAKNLQEIKESMSKEEKNKMDTLMANVLGTANEQLMKSETALNASRNEIEWLNYAKGIKELEFLSVQQRLEYCERIADILNTQQNTKESKQRTLKLIQETNHEYFKGKGQEFLNNLNKKTELFLIRQRRLQGVPKNPYEIGAAGIQELYDMF